MIIGKTLLTTKAPLFTRIGFVTSAHILCIVTNGVSVFKPRPNLPAWVYTLDDK